MSTDMYAQSVIYQCAPNGKLVQHTSKADDFRAGQRSQQQEYPAPPPYERGWPTSQGPSIHQQARELYDNALAHNESWAPTAQDAQMQVLPKIDFMLRVKTRLSRTSGQPFAVEPRSFRRPVPANFPPPSFPPIAHQSAGKSNLIGEGFKPHYYGPLFVAHDVSAADYSRFLEDIVTAGQVNALGLVVANVAPIALHIGFVGGFFVARAITRAMARRNEPTVHEAIEVWQQAFFGPRGLDVYVVQKGLRVTARAPGHMPPQLSPEAAHLTAGIVNAGKSKKTKRDKKEKKEKKRDKHNRHPQHNTHGEGYKDEYHHEDDRRNNADEHGKHHKKESSAPILIIAPLPREVPSSMYW